MTVHWQRLQSLQFFLEMQVILRLFVHSQEKAIFLLSQCREMEILFSNFESEIIFSFRDKSLADTVLAENANRDINTTSETTSDISVVTFLLFIEYPPVT